MKQYETYLDKDSLPFLYEVNDFGQQRSVDSPKVLAETVNSLYKLNMRAEEDVVLVTFNTKQEPVASFLVGRGGIRGAFIDTKGIFSKILLSGSEFFAILHNHPSGDPTPSGPDADTMANLEKGASILGLWMMDFIITGKDEVYWSARENELLKDKE